MADTTSSSPSQPSMIKWGALLIIGLMLLSGVAVFFAGQGNQTNSSPSSPSEQPLEAFTADEVHATVESVFSSAIVGGPTSESDKTVLDEAIQNLEEVKSLQSQFTKINPQDKSLTYIANVTLKENVDRQLFVQKIDELNLFSAPEIYFRASVSVPTSIDALSEKNEKKQITLPNSIIQGIVGPQTQPNDSIVGRLSASFQGSQLVNALLVETQNVSGAPSPLSFSGEYSLSGLVNTLTITGELHYFPSLSKETIRNGLVSMNGVSGVNEPIVPQINSTLFIQFKDSNVMFEDVNAFVSSNPKKYSFVFLVENGLNVGLKNVTVSQAEEELKNTILQTLLSNEEISFTVPQTQFLVDANISTSNTVPLSQNISQYFLSLDSNAFIQVFQNGFVDVNALVSPDENKSYVIDNGKLGVSVNPGHGIGDKILVQVDAIAIRGKLVYVNGVESDKNSLFP